MTTYFLRFGVVSMVLSACNGQVTSLGAIESGASAGQGDGDEEGGRPAQGVDAGTPETGGFSYGPGSGFACDPAAGQGCPDNEYCMSTTDATCGQGFCASRPPPPPPACPTMECACNGTIQCKGHSTSLGFDVGSNQCTVACGTTTCDALTSYCEHAAGGAPQPDGGTNEWYTCKPIPAACDTNRSCACVLANGSAGGTCETDANQKVRVFLPLP
jgi:hypothetical protein